MSSAVGGRADEPESQSEGQSQMPMAFDWVIGCREERRAQSECRVSAECRVSCRVQTAGCAALSAVFRATLLAGQPQPDVLPTANTATAGE